MNTPLIKNPADNRDAMLERVYQREQELAYQVGKLKEQVSQARALARAALGDDKQATWVRAHSFLALTEEY